MAIKIKPDLAIRPESTVVPGKVTLSVILETDKTEEDASLIYKIDGRDIAFDDGFGKPVYRSTAMARVKVTGTKCFHEVGLIRVGDANVARLTIALDVKDDSGAVQAKAAVGLEIE